MQAWPRYVAWPAAREHCSSQGCAPAALSSSFRCGRWWSWPPGLLQCRAPSSRTSNMGIGLLEGRAFAHIPVAVGGGLWFRLVHPCSRASCGEIPIALMWKGSSRARTARRACCRCGVHGADGFEPPAECGYRCQRGRVGWGALAGPALANA